MKLRIPLSKTRYLAVISAYAPTLTSPDEAKKQFYRVTKLRAWRFQLQSREGAQQTDPRLPGPPTTEESDPLSSVPRSARWKAPRWSDLRNHKSLEQKPERMKTGSTWMTSRSTKPSMPRTSLTSSGRMTRPPFPSVRDSRPSRQKSSPTFDWCRTSGGRKKQLKSSTTRIPIFPRNSSAHWRQSSAPPRQAAPRCWPQMAQPWSKTRKV